MPSAVLFGLAMLLSTTTLARGQNSPNHNPPNSEQLLVAVQRICPVSGRSLGSHGPPVRAKIGQQLLYLCCEDCLHNQVDVGHWSRIRANLAEAQQYCPVMGRALSEKARPVVIDGRLISICCSPCIDTIDGDREKYFRTVDGLYAAHLQSSRRLQAERAGAQHPGKPDDHTPWGPGGSCVSGGCP